MLAASHRPGLRSVLFVGFSLMVGLLAYTGYEFTTRLTALETQSAGVTRRYLEAQEQLTRIRSQVLLASVTLRDALLDPSLDAGPRYVSQLTDSYSRIDAALDTYVPVLGTAAERGYVERLRHEVADFRKMTEVVLARRWAQPVTDVRRLLNEHLVPRREAAIRVSEEVQALNRVGFIEHQTSIATLHRQAERRTWQQIGLTTLIGLGIGWFFTVYAARLQSNLQSEMAANVHSADQLRRLSSRLITAQAEERRHVARELHDEVGQALTAVQVELSLAQRNLRVAGHDAARLEDAAAITQRALDTVRDISQLLHPALLDDLGLAAAIEWQARSFQTRHAIHVDIGKTEPVRRLPRHVELTAYRIVQEALTNVAKHSGASHCRVTLRWDPDLMVGIEDNGVGFDPEAIGAATGGLGLVGIRERAAQLSGDVTIDARRGHGTRLIIRLPAIELARA